MTVSVLGIIGGSGIYDLAMDNARWERIASPWGEPSDAVRRGEIEGLAVVFLPRHGRGHVAPVGVAFRHPLHERTAHDRSVGTPVAHLAGLIRTGDAKAHGHRGGAQPPQPLHEGPHP
jgi:hypothetical protein